MIWTLAKSGSASLVTATAELSTLALLHALSVPLLLAFAMVQLVGITITFTLNKIWVFDARNSGRIRIESARAVPVFGGAFLLNTVLPSLGAYFLGLSPFWAYLTSQLIVYAVWSFPLNRWWVFPALRPVAKDYLPSR